MYDCYISCLRQVLCVWTWGLFPAKRPRAVLIHFMIEWKADSTGVESLGFPSDIPGFKSWPCPLQVTWPLANHFIFLPLHFLTWKCGINACLLEFTWRLKGSIYVPSRRSLAWEAHVSVWLVLLDKFPGCRDQTEYIQPVALCQAECLIFLDVGDTHKERERKLKRRWLWPDHWRPAMAVTGMSFTQRHEGVKEGIAQGRG